MKQQFLSPSEKGFLLGLSTLLLFIPITIYATSILTRTNVYNRAIDLNKNDDCRNMVTIFESKAKYVDMFGNTISKEKFEDLIFTPE